MATTTWSTRTFATSSCKKKKKTGRKKGGEGAGDAVLIAWRGAGRKENPVLGEASSHSHSHAGNELIKVRIKKEKIKYNTCTFILN
jgi:hypothetical protein